MSICANIFFPEQENKRFAMNLLEEKKENTQKNKKVTTDGDPSHEQAPTPNQNKCGSKNPSEPDDQLETQEAIDCNKSAPPERNSKSLTKGDGGQLVRLCVCYC